MTISNRTPDVVVEYTAKVGKRTERRRRLFTCPWEGRRFYANKLRNGKEPRVCKPTPADYEAE